MDNHVKLELTGMTCSACANRIEKVVSKVSGVNQINVNYAMEVAHVSFDDNVVDVSTIIQRIEKIGYGASEQKKVEKSDLKLWWSIGLSFPLLWTMVAHFGLSNWLWVPEWLMNPWVQLILATPVQFIVGYSFYRSAWLSLISKVLNMDVLVVLGTSTAYLYSVYLLINWQMMSMHHHPELYFETSAILITLILFGKFLESKAKGKASKAIRKLLGLQTNIAHVIRDSIEMDVNIREVHVGDMLVIKPGEKIPVDGKVVEGESYVNESMLTGESMPIHKEKGDQVFSATINGTQTMKIVAEKIGSSTLLAQIVKTVTDAQASKAPIQRYADKISSIFVPFVIAIAAIVFMISLFFLTPFELKTSLERTIAVLVIACPCALGLATPTSILAGTGRAAEFGILFRGGEFLERTYLTDTIVFDKTGTITEGAPTLIFNKILTERIDENQFNSIVYAIEKQSEHPLSKAIISGLSVNQDNTKAHEFKAFPGFGVQAKIGEEMYYIGNRKWMNTHGVYINHVDDMVIPRENEGLTVMYVAQNSECIGLLGVIDQIREDASVLIQRLNKMGLEVIMMSGDNERTVRAISQQVNITQAFSNLLPVDKAKHIHKLKADGKKVMMVGDGINDAPALAVSDIGVAMGTGSDVAIESAGITLIKGDLHKIVSAIEISRSTMRNIRQNLGWALIYNVIGIPIAALGYLSPWIAGTAMTLSSISVVLNALRLQKIKL